MTEVSFYHLQKASLEEALPILLEKTLDAGKRALVLTGSDAQVEQLNKALWSSRQDSWLPHGAKNDGRGEDQPIWLTAIDENPNAATFMFLTNGASGGDLGVFERCFDLFDGNDTAQVTAARERWKACRDAGYRLKYLQQTDSGGWQEKATG